MDDIVKFTQNMSNVYIAKKAYEFLSTHDVLVGIPQSTSSREGDPVTNAELLFIHTNGSPIRNIPPRPVIKPALKNSKDDINRYRMRILKSAVRGEFNEARDDMERLGLKAQKVCRNWFDNPENGWAPNSPATIARKGSDRPLIDTGELRKSITYVVRKRGSGR